MIRLMVEMDGISDDSYPSSSIWNRIASAPTRKYLAKSAVPSISDFLMFTIACSMCSSVLFGITMAFFGRSLYHPFRPVLYRDIHLLNQRLDLSVLLYISTGFSPSRYLWIALIRSSSSGVNSITHTSPKTYHGNNQILQGNLWCEPPIFQMDG